MNKNLKIYGVPLMFAAVFGLSSAVLAQTNGGNSQTASANSTNNRSRSISNGQKEKIRGVVVDRQADTLTVKDQTGATVSVKIMPDTSIKSKKFFGSGRTYAADLLTRGLYLEAEGTGDSSGALMAKKIRFGEDDLRNAQALEARVSPVEERVTAAEQNAQKLSGQLDELVAISNAARGGAKAAQETADAAVQGVNATNNRITELDDYNVQSTATINFKVGSAILSPEAKAQLDTVAQGATGMKGYVMEVTGYADSTGNAERNRVLSQRRAEAVIQYLVEKHGVPLRRILPSYGYGATNAVADNSTREGRAQNRRVEVKLLVSKGLTNTVEIQKPN
jgi:outer membrane protein OmpA-like peptidoglycan-associated protein